MARGDKFNVYLIDGHGKYITADLQADGTYVLTRTTSADPLADGLFIKNLPKEWDGTEITWERNTTYYGIFRSLSTSYQFTLDARAILLSIYSVENTQAFCRMRIDVLLEDNNPSTPADVWKYDTFYNSDINFGELKDNKKEQILTVSTLDSKLFSLLKANANKNFNIPFWLYDSGTDTWDVATDTEFIYTQGCKVLWSTSYISGATSTSPIAPPFAGDLYPFNHGSVSDSRHWIPAMNQYNIVQNNGTTTFLGNDILQPFLIQQNQAFNYNRNFEGTDDIQAYSKNRGLLKNFLKNPQDTDVVSMDITVSGEFDGAITYAGIHPDEFIGFVLFEIDNQDMCAMSGGNYIYSTIYLEMLPAGGSPYTPSAPFSATAQVDLKYDKCYVLGIIYDSILTGLSGITANCALSNLELKIESSFNSGTASPVNAPRFPFSTFPAIRARHVWEKLVHVIDSTATDAYGFPTGGGQFSGDSGFLQQTLPFVDLIPNNMMFTSENALRQVAGQPYLTISVQDFFTTMFKTLGLGLGMSSTATGLPFDNNILVLEKLNKFFDWQTLVYDLTDNVANFTIEPLTDIKADNIKAGYTATQTNNNFGVDSFLLPQEYATQLVNTPKDLDLQATSVIVDQNQIEKARAQNNTRQQSNPSASNGLILIEVADTSIGTVLIRDPSNVAHFFDPWDVKLYPTAQSTDPTAATAPYVQGLYYPETAMNLSLTPASNMIRLGYFLDSLCFGTDKIIFRKQYQMQYNNVSAPFGAPTALPGIAKNLDYGLIQEVADIYLPIIPATSPDKLFRPELFTVETQTPVNLYTIINSNPYGYIKFTWINPFTGVRTVYKGFIWKVSQKIGNNASTTITLLAHPLTTDADIAMA